jgi:Lambda phage tail tube protein, TTP
MPQAASEAFLSYDWEMWVGRTVAMTTTWTQIFGFEALPFPEQVPEDIDVTHLQSPGRTRETMPGLIPVVDWSQEKQLWNDAGDTLLEELAELTAEGSREDVLIEFNIDPAGTGIRRTYRAYVNQFTPTGSVGEKAMATVEVKILDRQASNTRTIV